MPVDLDSCLSFAHEMANAARLLARRYFRDRSTFALKSDSSPVTLADRQIEATLRSMIEARYPQHGILGEEFGASGIDRPSVWIIDPIDGTKSFATGMPLFGTLVGLMHDNRPLLGLIEMPALEERWVGLPDAGTSLNGNICVTSRCTELGASRLYTTSYDPCSGEDAARLARLSEKGQLRCFGGDCYVYGLLASGHIDLVCEVGLAPHDYLPLVPVVQGAGGVITDWSGRALTRDSDGRVLAAANRELHARALAILATST